LLMENSRAFKLEIAKECGEMCDGGSMLASHPSFSERIQALSE